MINVQVELYKSRNKQVTHAVADASIYTESKIYLTGESATDLDGVDSAIVCIGFELLQRLLA